MLKRFSIALVSVMLAATSTSLADQTGTHFTLIISNARDSAININDEFRGYYPNSCSPVTSEYGESLAAGAQKRHTCDIGGRFRQGDPIYDVMTSDRNHYICHVYWDQEHGVFALGVTGNCSVSQSGDSATVTVH
jgi:hypothetical protein